MLSKVFNSSLLKFKKSTPPVFGSLVNEEVKQSYIEALASIKPYSLSNINKVSFKLISNGNLCVASCENDNKCVSIVVYDRNFSQLVQKLVMLDVHQGFQLVELNKTVIVCIFGPKASAINFSSSRIIKYDYDLNVISEFGLDFEVNYADAHEKKLYMFSTNSYCQTKHVYLYDESLKLLKKIKFGIRKGRPFYVPNSVTKIRVAENYFVLLNGTKVLLMDRDDGVIKRIFGIGSSDFELDSSNNRILAYDGKTEKLACFDFEGESIEISYNALKKFELVDYGHHNFVFYDVNLFCIYF